MPRRLKQVVLFLFLGLIVSLGVAVGLAMWIDVAAGPAVTGSRGDWTVTAQQAFGSLRATSARIRPNWSPGQATGMPNTPAAGDFPTAWAAQTNNGSPEWLELTYDQPRVPKFIDVHETYCPGGLTRVTVIEESGQEREVWSGEDPTPPSATKGVSRVVVNGNVPPVRKVKVYIGRTGVRGWNEIDAVGLVDGNDVTHWAVDAAASSFYGQGSYYPIASAPTPPAELVPSWSGLAAPGANGPPPGEVDERAVEARGWPMLAMWAPAPPSGATGSVSFNTVTSSSTSLLLTYGSGPGRLTVAPVAKVMPYRPIALGLLVDTVCYAVVLALLWAILVIPRRFFVEVSRLRRGCCVRCGYDIGYDFPHGCPECGWRREGDSVYGRQ